MGGLRLHDRVPAVKRETEEIAAVPGRWPGMSFVAAPAVVKRLAGGRAIAEAGLSRLKTVSCGGAPVRLAAAAGRPDAKRGEAVAAFAVAAGRVARRSAGDLDRTCLDRVARFGRPGDCRFAGALPAGHDGKAVKREPRDRLRAGTADGGSR